MAIRNYNDLNFEGTKVLVTGGAGFIGSHIVDALLDRGAYVRVLDDLSTGNRKNLDQASASDRFEFMEGSITSTDTCEAAVAGMNLVCHQAALGSVPRSVAHPLRTHEVNATGMLNMLIAAKNAGIKRFVYASSSSVYGDDTNLPKTESRTGRPLSPYAATKCSNEDNAHAFAKAYNMEPIGLRYFNIFGPRQSPEGAYAAVIPLFVQAARRNEAPIIHGDGSQSRDFTYVANAVMANLLALSADRAAADSVYNIACGTHNTLLQLWNAIAGLAQCTSKPTHVNTRVGDVKHSLANISNAIEHLSYVPSIELQKGLELLMNE